jgi:hypothetical protein
VIYLDHNATTPLARISSVLMKRCLMFLFVVLFSLPLHASEQGTLIIDILLRGKDVFASTGKGIFQANLQDKTWHHLSLPESMPPAGRFAWGAKTTGEIFYYASRNNTEAYAPGVHDVKYGLYRSVNNGKTWGLLSAADDFSSVIILPKGLLYALFGDSGFWRAHRAAVSRDAGKSWKTIADSGPQTGYILLQFYDPDHPALVCLLAQVTRGSRDVLQADDDSYHWVHISERDWYSAHQTDDHFFSDEANTNGGFLQATLENYFKYDFGSSITFQSPQIVPQQKIFNFKKDGPKQVEISVVRWDVNQPVKFADQDEDSSLWGIRVVTPAGERKIITSPFSVNYLKDVDRLKAVANLAATQKFDIHDISVAHPYKRLVDLAALYDFPVKGTYKIELIYDSFWAGEIKLDAFSGSLGSQVFKVNIK